MTHETIYYSATQSSGWKEPDFVDRTRLVPFLPNMVLFVCRMERRLRAGWKEPGFTMIHAGHAGWKEPDFVDSTR